MKLTRCMAILIIFTVLLSFFASCMSDSNAHISCTDLDGDGLCDYCKTSLNPLCTSHIDKNSDGLCDSCNAEVDLSCTSHVDEDGDSLCDKCASEIERRAITLIDGGKAKFNFVLGSDIGSNMRSEVNLLKTALSEIGIAVEVLEDTADNVTDCEILIGTVTSRGDKYTYDKYSLGKDGHALVGIDNKLIITGGAENSLSFAFTIFVEDVLGFTEDVTESLENIVFTKNVIEIQDDYKITSLTVRGEDIKDYTIAVDKSDTTFYDTALRIQDILYANTGCYLPIVTLSEADKSIILERVAAAGEDGFRITTTDGGALHIECAYHNKLIDAVSGFLAHEIQLSSGDIDFGADYLYTERISIVTYEEFGAKGNGYTDDYEAIKAAHLFANEGGQTVVARVGAHYYMRAITSTIHVKTDVIWEGASFTIDEKSLTKDDPYNKGFFWLAPDVNKFTLNKNQALGLFPEGRIDKDNLTIKWPYDFPALVVIYNDNHKNYVRYEGASSISEGASQMEFISVDKNGNIDENTPLLFDYEDITKLVIIRTDDKPITLKGGTFTTLASQIERPGTSYIGHGIMIRRSNATLDGVKHYIVGELDKTKAHQTSGFFFVEDTANVTLQNCVLTGHTAGGSYDLSMYRSNNVLVKNCTQSNFFKENGDPSMHNNEYWGIMGSNYCKNVTFDTCTLSRFDAHQGIYNATIKNSTINAIEVIGGGTFLVENTTFHLSRNLMFDLRSDYGSTFKGEIVIRNCHVVNYNPAECVVIKANWHNVDFGYKCTLPNIVIDGLTFDEVIGNVTLINIIAKRNNYDYKYDLITKENLIDGTKNNNPIAPPDYIKVLNNDMGYNYVLLDVYYFDNVILEGAQRGE